MRRRKRFLSLAMAGTLMAGMLAGCGGEAGEPKESGNGQGTEAANGAGGETVTLRFSWWGGDDRHEATLEAIKLFEEKYPNIKISPEYSGFDGYQSKLSASLAGGQEADVMQIDQPWMGTFLAQNPDFFVDFHTLEDTIDLSGFSEDFLNDFCMYDGKLLSLPTGTNAINFLANQAVLEKAGVEFGETITWEDLLEQGKKVNEADPESYLINLDSGTAYFVTRIYLYQLTGKNFINDDYTIGFTRDEFIQAFEMTKKLYDEKVIMPLEESMIFKGSPQDNPKWNNGQSGGWFNWSSTANLNDWGDDAVSLPYPQVEGGKSTGLIVRPAQVYAISSNSEHPKEAALFLDFLFNDPEAVRVLKDCRSIPAVEKSRELLQEEGLVYGPAVDAINMAMKAPGNKETTLSTNSEVESAFGSVVEKVIYGQSAPDAAADEIISLLTDILANLKADAE